MCALREEGDEKKVHCQLAPETSSHRQSWKSEDAGTHILDNMPRLNAKGTLWNSEAKL